MEPPPSRTDILPHVVLREDLLELIKFPPEQHSKCFKNIHPFTLGVAAASGAIRGCCSRATRPLEEPLHLLSLLHLHPPLTDEMKRNPQTFDRPPAKSLKHLCSSLKQHHDAVMFLGPAPPHGDTDRPDDLQVRDVLL